MAGITNFLFVDKMRQSRKWTKINSFQRDLCNLILSPHQGLNHLSKPISFYKHSPIDLALPASNLINLSSNPRKKKLDVDAEPGNKCSKAENSLKITQTNKFKPKKGKGGEGRKDRQLILAKSGNQKILTSSRKNSAIRIWMTIPIILGKKSLIATSSWTRINKRCIANFVRKALRLPQWLLLKLTNICWIVIEASLRKGIFFQIRSKGKSRK